MRLMYQQEGFALCLVLSPHRDEHQRLLEGIGMKPDEIKARLDHGRFDTIGTPDITKTAELYWRLVDGLTGAGWEPFRCDDRSYLPLMHFRRQLE